MTKETYFQKIGDLQMMSEFEDNNIRLTFLSGVSGYKCDITQTHLDQVQQKLAGKYDNVADMARTTFSKADQNQFSLTVEDKDGAGSEKVLVWRKLGGKAKLRLAVFDVESVSLSIVLDTIFIFLNKDRSCLQSRLHETEKELSEVKSEVERLSKLAEDLNKTSTEDDLLEQFLPLLNSKKARIAQLENELANAVGTQKEDTEEDYYADSDVEQLSNDHQDNAHDQLSDDKDFEHDTDVEQDDNNEENNVSEDNHDLEDETNQLKRNKMIIREVN